MLGLESKKNECRLQVYFDYGPHATDRSGGFLVPLLLLKAAGKQLGFDFIGVFGRATNNKDLSDPKRKRQISRMRKAWKNGRKLVVDESLRSQNRIFKDAFIPELPRPVETPHTFKEADDLFNLAAEYRKGNFSLGCTPYIALTGHHIGEYSCLESRIASAEDCKLRYYDALGGQKSGFAYLDNYREEIRRGSALPEVDPSFWKPGALRVAVGIRRGDVMQRKWHMRQLQNDYYTQILDQIKGANRDVDVAIFSTYPFGPTDDFTSRGYRLLLANESSSDSDAEAMQHLAMMASADVVILSRSTFHYLAGLITRGSVIYTYFYKTPPLSSFIKIRGVQRKGSSFTNMEVVVNGAATPLKEWDAKFK